MHTRHRLIHLLLALAVCSASGNSVLADSNTPIMVVFTESGSNTPQCSTWNGSAWIGSAAMPSVGAEPYWVVLQNCPVRNETACATLDADEDVNLLFYNGSSWSSATQLCDAAGASSDRPLDLAYEQASGDLLVAYWDDGSNDVGYRTYDGSTLSGESHLTPPSSQNCMFITLYPKPASDEIILLALNANDELFAAIWSGSSWGSTTTLETSIETDTEECYSLAFEGQSGDALVVYVQSGQDMPRYRTWTGSSWSSEAQMPDIGADGRWLRLAADTASDEIIFGSLDEAKDINVCVWNGSSWGSNLEVESGTQSYGMRQFDIAYEFGGDEALLAYHQNNQNNLRYRTWNGASWSSEVQGTQLNDKARVIQLRTGTTAGELFIATSETGDDLEMIRWDGSSMSGKQTLESSLGDLAATEQFMVAIPAGDASYLFADASGATGFGVPSTTDSNSGSGLHWGDLDNDGDLDAIVTGNSSSRLCINNNTGQSFSQSTFGGGARSRQGALLDIDNDGDLDFWHCDEKLYENNGSASFTDRGDLGFGDPSNSDSAAAADLNHDGQCDVVMFSTSGNWIGFNSSGSPATLTGTNDSAYGLNDSGDAGNGDFCSAGDVNNDGYLDFFYHYNSGKLFLSEGDGTYAQDNHGISVVTGNSDTMGSTWADYDNDGDLDLFVARHDSGSAGYLWRNDVDWTADTGSFTNVSASAGIIDTSGQRGCCWGDYDNDGDLDLYVVTHSAQVNVLYQNQGNGTFVSVNEGTNASGDGHDAVFVDYDNDGDLDLSVTQQSATNTLLNNGTDNTDYLKVRVVGLGDGGTNLPGVGVRIDVWDAAGTTFLARREIGTARGYGGAEPMWAHFGGLTNSSTYTVKVYFHSRANDEPYAVSVVPSAASTTIGATVIPQMLTVEEPNTQKKILHWTEIINKTP